MLSLHNHQDIELGAYAVNGELPDMRLTGCKVTWGDYPPARVGRLDCDDNTTLQDVSFFTTGPRIARHWLFWFRVLDNRVWMGKKEDIPIRFENCTFADSKSVEVA